MLRRWLQFVFVLASCLANAQDSPALVRVGDIWQFFKATTPPAGAPLDWTRPNYQVGAEWLTGRSGIGTYVGGRDSENVLLFDRNYNYVSVLFRRDFVLQAPESIQLLVLRLDYQEGFVAYLNGREILRVGLAGPPGQPVPFQSLASTRSTVRPAEFLVPVEAASLLVAGANTLAIQMHTDRVGPGFPASPTTGDLICVPELLANFQRGPFIQNTSTSQVYVVWKTPLLSTGTVHVGLTPTTLARAANTSATGIQHEVAVTGLQPDTTYYYQVQAAMNGIACTSSVASFTTAKPAGSISFCVLGDSGSGTGSQYRTAQLIQQRNPDLVLHCGDVVYGSFDPFRADTRCLSVYQPHMRSTPYYFTVGNHDMTYDGSASYIAAFSLPTNDVSLALLAADRTAPEHYYSFDHGDVHFICLFNPMLMFYDFAPGTTQYAWLERDLAKTTKKWKVIFQHIPVRTSGPHIYDESNFNGLNDTAEVRDALLPLASRYGVSVIFAGHDHLYERFVPEQGVHLITTGAGGVIPLYGAAILDPLSARLNVLDHFTHVQVQDDTMTIRAVGTNDVIFDEFVIQKKPTQVPSTLLAAFQLLNFPDSGAPDNDGNLLNQRWPFLESKSAIAQSISGSFANLGRLHVASDNTNLFLGLDRVMIPPGSDIVLFLETPGLAGVDAIQSLGTQLFDPKGQGVDTLDTLKNISFSKFKPSVACVLGDEWADGTFRDFLRSGANHPGGQGVFWLDTTFSSIPSAKLQQFNQTPQGLPGYGEANANLIVLAIPCSDLGNLKPLETIRIGAIVLQPVSELNVFNREIDSGFIGSSLLGSGTNAVVLEPLVWTLPADADPDQDGLLTEIEQQLGTDPSRGDTDDDGLNDHWEVTHQLNPLSSSGPDGARGDVDNDGLANLDEQRLQTNPRDPASRIELRLTRLPNGILELSWPKLLHSAGTVEMATQPGGSFSVVGEVDPGGDPRFRVDLLSSPQYYRFKMKRVVPVGR